MNLKIGTFKQLTGLSEGTLRYYEKIGLIDPARDDTNDYRHFGDDDFLNLVQIKQLSAFDIPLHELLDNGRLESPDAMQDLLVNQRRILEERINDLYERLARLKLHEAYFERIRDPRAPIERMNILGIYRLFISDPNTAAHPETGRITARWLSKMPYTHASIRIPREELLSKNDGPYSIHIGIGMLERYFNEAGETFRPPMQYSPPQSCVHGMVRVPDLRAVTRKDLEPFFEYFLKHSLLPLDDMFGWVVYIARGRSQPQYCLSMRVAVG